VLVQSRRDKKAAKRLFRKALEKQARAPRVLITGKLRSYAAAGVFQQFSSVPVEAHS
jgi:putative transposase